MPNDFVIKKGVLNGEFYLYAYLGNESVVTIPDGVTHINFHVFADKYRPNDTITKIIIPDSVKSIESEAFSYCRALKVIRWPCNEDFNVICPNLFEGCVSLEKISIPKSIKGISTFLIPKNLKNIELHDDLKIVSQSSIVYEDNEAKDQYFNNNDTIRILLKNPNYKIIDGFMVNTKYKIALFDVEHDRTEVCVPVGIEMIATHCFEEYGYFERGFDINGYRNRKIVPVERVIIPASVKKILSGAFWMCKNLRSVVYRGKSSNLKASGNIFEDCGFMSSLKSKIVCSDMVVKNKTPTSFKLDRIVFIHQEIKKGNFPSTNKLRDKCRDQFASGKLSTATISRDIEYLRTRFRAPIEYDAIRKGYYYPSDFTLSFE